MFGCFADILCTVRLYNEMSEKHRCALRACKQQQIESICFLFTTDLSKRVYTMVSLAERFRPRSFFCLFARLNALLMILSHLRRQCEFIAIGFLIEIRFRLPLQLLLEFFTLR